MLKRKNGASTIEDPKMHHLKFDTCIEDYRRIVGYTVAHLGLRIGPGLTMASTDLNENTSSVIQ